MEIRNLKSFKSIVEEGSFVKASKKLFCTQSTITSHIQQLEEELQVKLFEKIGRKMHLSSFGRELLPYAEKLLSVVNEIEGLGKDRNSMKGELKIVMGDSFVSYEFQDIFIKFRELAPQVKLSVITVDILLMREILEKGEIDIGFLYEDSYKGTNLVDTFFKKIPVSLVASKDSNISTKDFNLKNQKLDTSFITNEFNSPYRINFIEYLNQKNIEINNLIEIWSIEGIKKSVKNNLGITYLPDFVMKDELEKGDFVKIDIGCRDNEVEGIYSIKNQ